MTSVPAASSAAISVPTAVVVSLEPLLTISFLNAVLYGMLCMQCYMYFTDADGVYKRTKPLMITVAVLWALNTFHLICSIYTCSWEMITKFGDSEAVLTVAPWSSLALFLTSLTSNLIVQGWFTWRVYILSGKNKWIGGALCISAFATWASGTAVCIIGLISSSLAAIAEKQWIIFLTDSLDIFTNLTLTVILCYHFMKFRRSPVRRTRSVVNALIVYTINTGALGLAISATSMLLRGVQPDNAIYFAEYIPYSQLYTNALLASLSTRDWLWQRKVNSTQMMSIPLSNFNAAQEPTEYSHDSSTLGRTQEDTEKPVDLEVSARTEVMKATL